MLTDSYGRVATDLRVSLTDRCNLRCSYCMPPEGLDWLPTPEVLTGDELVRLISDWVPQLMAILVAQSSLGDEPLRKAQEIEEKLAVRSFQLIMAVLRLGITPSADCYDPQVLERHLPQIIELSGVIGSSRKAYGNREK